MSKFLIVIYLIFSFLGTVEAKRLSCRGKTYDTRINKNLDIWFNSNLHYIDSIQILYCGKLVYSRYFRAFNKDTIHEIQSATKSIASILIGIAIKKGIIQSIDIPIRKLLPQYKKYLTGQKSKITLRHILTMSSGLRWKDFGLNNSFERINKASDSIAFVLNEPLVSKPGIVFSYNTGSSHLLSAIISKLTKMSTFAFAKKNLFRKLKIKDVFWPQLKDGIFQGGWGMYLKPLDMLKIGKLLLNEGRWGKEQIIDQAFVREALSPHYKVTKPYTSRYGFQFWIENFKLPRYKREFNIPAARGFGGQDIFILRDFHTVITVTGNTGRPLKMKHDVNFLLINSILPGIY